MEDPGVYGNIILIWISGSGIGRIVWIDLAEDRDRRRALVSTVMNLRVL
jgi:hypothetical protein